MDSKQVRTLCEVRDQLLAAAPEQVNMHDLCLCAIPRVELLLLHRRADNLPLADDLGLDDDEYDYLFAIRYGFGNKGCYVTPTGHAGAEEFAERLENILQFHRL